MNNDVVYADGGDERLYALRANDGSVIWSVSSRALTEDLLVTDRHVYAISDGYLAAYDRESGATVATKQLSFNVDVFETAAAARGNQVFITRTTGAWSFTHD